MKKILILALSLIAGVKCDDIFNFGYQTVNANGETSYGMPDWDDVSCSNTDTCVSIHFLETLQMRFTALTIIPITERMA